MRGLRVLEGLISGGEDLAQGLAGRDAFQKIGVSRDRRPGELTREIIRSVAALHRIADAHAEFHKVSLVGDGGVVLVLDVVVVVVWCFISTSETKSFGRELTYIREWLCFLYSFFLALTWNYWIYVGW